MWLDHLLSREIEVMLMHFKISLHPKVEAVEVISFYANHFRDNGG